MLRMEDAAVLAGLLAVRDRLSAATGTRPESMALMVPERALHGVTEAFGSKVIHSDVGVPMVAIAVITPGLFARH
jgi:hypothetical protein